MTDRVILELSPGWFVLADDNQWILSTGPSKPADARLKAAEPRYRPVAYIGGQKRTLARVSKEKGASITPKAQAVLDSWPDRFLDWKALQDGRVVA